MNEEKTNDWSGMFYSKVKNSPVKYAVAYYRHGKPGSVFFCKSDLYSEKKKSKPVKSFLEYSGEYMSLHNDRYHVKFGTDLTNYRVYIEKQTWPVKF